MAAYKITDSQQVDKMTPGANLVTVYRVWILTDNGASGSVEVPASKWNDKDLPEILEAKAAELDLAFTLTSE